MMANHPAAQEQVHQEAVRALVKCPPTAAAFPNLKYAYMVFAESMRLYPPVWAIGRSAGPEPYDFHDFQIPAGAVLIAPQFVVHRDPRFWADPEMFIRCALPRMESLQRENWRDRSLLTILSAPVRGSALAKAWRGWRSVRAGDDLPQLASTPHARRSEYLGISPTISLRPSRQFRG